MHKFFLNLAIALLFPAVVLSSNTKHYDKEWLLVDSLIDKQEQIKAINAVKTILDKAEADDNSYEILRCALMINRLDSPRPKNARYSAQSYMLFDSLESVMDDDGLKAICHYLEAVCLKEYLSNSNYRIPSGNPLGIEQDQLKDKFHYHFNQAFSLAKRKRTKDYIHFIPDCSHSFLKLRPQLQDVLMENSCFTIGRAAWSNENPFITELLKSDERLLGDASQFLKAVSSADLDNIHLWQIHTLKLLTENNLRANADIRATIDYKRLRTIVESVSPTDWISVAEKIERLADSYRHKSRYSAGIYMLAAKVLIEHVTDQTTIEKELRSRLSVHAHDLLMDAIGIWPDSENAHECRELLSRIEKRTLNISFDRIERADVPNLAMLTYSNIDTVWFKAIRYDKSSYDNLKSYYNINKTIAMIQDGSIAGTNEAANWSVATARVNHNDWIEHSMWVSLPALEKGEYIILASPDRNFMDENCYAYRFLTSSRILFTPTYLTGTDNDAELTGFLSYASTGAALSDCSYTLCGYDDLEESDFNIQGQTGADGFIRVAYPASADNDLMLIVNHNTCSDTLEIETRSTYKYNYSRLPFSFSKGPVHVKINTDRAVYRPGDTIRYCGIISETPPQMDGHVMAGMPVVVFISANRQDLPLQETVSDVHGCFEGEWPIPADFRAGWIDLCAFSYPEGEDLESIFKNTDKEYLYLPGNSKEIKIESYSRQLLQLKFDQLMTPPIPGSEVECTGRVFSILGNPVGGAQIQWSTSVNVRDDESFASGDIYIDKILETGKTQTRPDGSFSIRFKADAGPRGWIELTTRVTDDGGETHEDSREIYMYNDPSMGVSVQNSIIGPDDPLLTVRTYGNYPWTGQYKVRIEALHQNQSKGIDIYTAFKVRESERKEMSETALTEGVLTELFPGYEFGLPATPHVSHTLMDSTFVSHGYKTDSICVPGIRTGLYRITMTSDSVDINHKGNTYSQDIFISVDYSTDPLTVNDLLWMPSRQDILREGDTATVRIGSPYPGTIIRYDVINRNGSLTHGTMIADGMTHTLSFPVNEDLCGSILIVATAMKDGMTAKSYSPGYIPYYSKQLKYELTTFHSNLTSGNEESWTFRITDSQGKPVRASVMAAMYDSSLDRIESNRWEFFPWQYMEFITANPVHIDQNYRKMSLAEKILPFDGIRSIGLGIADPLTTPLWVGLPIPLREASSSVSASEYIPYMVDNNRQINNSDNQVAFMEPTDIRKNLSHTGLYKIGLQTDQDGYVTIRFKAPELLTRWNLQVFAYTDSLLTTGFGGYVTTSRPLMVESSVPRFFRQGDVTDFVQKVTNTMESDTEVTVKVSFTDASRNTLDLTGGDSIRIVTVKAGRTVSVPFRLTIPEGIKEVTYTVTAASDSFSDGQQETVQVLSNRVSVTRSMSLFNNGNETRLFRSDAPALSATGRISDQELTLQYHSHPIFYAIDALPSLTENSEPDNISLLYDFAARCISGMIAENYPSLRNRLDPLYSDSASFELMYDSYMDMIRSRLNPDGGMPWMPGGVSSAYVTSIMLYIFDFLDMTFYFSYNNALTFLASCVNEKTNHLSHQDILFLYLFSKRNKARSTEPETQSKYNTLLELATKYNHKNEDLYYRGLLIQLFMSCGNTAMAHRIADDLIAESGYSDELGRYWNDNRGGYLWHEAPVETQAVIIRALKAAGYDREADESARWLLKQKETTRWESTPATAMAIMALLETSSGSQPQAESGVTLTIGNERIESDAHSNDDGYMSRTWSGPVSPDKAVITVTSSTDGISWGALYHTFTQDLADVEQSGNGMHLERTLYRIVKDTEGEHLEEITPGTTLSKGDRIKVKLTLSTDRTYEYVRLRSQRAASLEPLSTKAGYTYNITKDLLYYWAPANTSDDLYIDRLEKGTYSIEYDLYVQKSGTFSMGLATIECLYAPAYRAIAPNTVLNCQ